MAMYNAPGVYIKDISNGSNSATQASASVGLMIGKTRNGKINVPQKVGSWIDFLNRYSNGLDTPFIENDYLAYAVYGFFANGGSQLYIISVKKNAVKAKATSEKNGIVVTAANEGVWGNDLKLKITKNADWVDGSHETYDLQVDMGVNNSVLLKDLTKDDMANIASNNKVKMWIGGFTIPSDVTTLQEEEIALAGGTEGDELTNKEYEDALQQAVMCDDVTMIAIPGQTSAVLNTSLLAFCDTNGFFPIIDMPRGSSAEDTRVYRKGISAWTGALTYPWGVMSDPLTNGGTKTVPACGHYMGLCSRTIENYGIHKAPAGVNATLRGFVDLETAVTPTELGDLNVAGVVVTMSRPNAGIVPWGARSLNSSDSTLRYVTDGFINLNIKKTLYNSTQYAVFEPNDVRLWISVKATCEGFLEKLRSAGTLKGSATEAYYVIVDGSNNTPDTIAEGELHIEVGYAPVKPAEFIVIKLAHSIVSA